MHFDSINVFKVVALSCSLCVSEVLASDLLVKEDFSLRAARFLSSVMLPEARLLQIPLIVQHLEEVLGTRWPGCKAMIYGSTKSGLALQQSDVDCFVLLSHYDPSAVYVEQAKLALEQHPGLFSNFRLSRNTTIPTVTFKHIPTGFIVDLNFKTSQGIYNTELVRYLIHTDERVLHLMLIVKYWAKVHGITGRKRLASYGMVQLVIFYLQYKHILPSISFLQRNAKPYFVENWNTGFNQLAYEPKNIEPLYNLLGGFFEYYNHFDFDENLVSTFVARPIKRQLFKDLRNVPIEFDLYRQNVSFNITKPLDLNLACIQDSFQHNINVAKQMDAGPGSQFADQFKFAALKYRESNESMFLDELLNTGSDQIRPLPIYLQKKINQLSK